MNIYDKAIQKGLQLQGTCVNATAKECEQLMENCKIANKRKVDAILKKLGHLPQDFFKFRNPYRYYYTATHIIYVHSAIEYFFKIKD